MTITAYMYQSPLETDYADDVDSDETTEEAAEKPCSRQQQTLRRKK